MQFPITIGLHRSFFWAGGAIFFHVVSLLAIWIPDWNPAVAFGGSGLIVLSALWSARQWKFQDAALRLMANGRLECRFEGSNEFMPAELVSAATVHRLLTVVPVKTSGGRAFVLALPDSGSANDLRQLRVWLRWRADFKAGADHEE
ncbi:MAG: hypothetical protein ACM3SV_12605 [Betaproteobacteria bacterium]